MKTFAWIVGGCAVVSVLGCAAGRTTPDAGGDRPRDAGSTLDAPMQPEDAGRDAGPPDLCDGVDCSSLDAPCVTGTCDPADGSCDAVAMADGASCDDGDPCTTTDVCGSGACAGVAVDCSALDSACGTGFCDTDGSCAVMPVIDGTICDDADACTSGDICASGSCAGTTVDCSALDDDCNVGTCDPTSGTCTAMAVADGASCDDGDTCTSGDVCAAGACAGAPIPGCGSGVLVPGRTDLIVGQGGWSVRCLSWSGRICTHLQGRMECSVCGIYAYCGVWHDITTFNDSDDRSSVNWCALATGNATILSKGSGGASVAPRGCGWGSTTHPHCETTRATFHVPVTGVPTAHGALLNESYCGAYPLLTLDCAGW